MLVLRAKNEIIPSVAVRASSNGQSAKLVSVDDHLTRVAFWQCGEIHGTLVSHPDSWSI